jgi:hypothetical protein
MTRSAAVIVAKRKVNLASLSKVSNSSPAGTTSTDFSMSETFPVTRLEAFTLVRQAYLAKYVLNAEIRESRIIQIVHFFGEVSIPNDTNIHEWRLLTLPESWRTGDVIQRFYFPFRSSFQQRPDIPKHLRTLGVQRRFRP